MKKRNQNNNNNLEFGRDITTTSTTSTRNNRRNNYDLGNDSGGRYNAVEFASDFARNQNQNSQNQSQRNQNQATQDQGSMFRNQSTTPGSYQSSANNLEFGDDNCLNCERNKRRR